MLKNPILESLKVKKEVIALIKTMVKDGYYRLDEEGKIERLRTLAQDISQVYNVGAPDVEKNGNGGAFAVYYPLLLKIELSNGSIVSFLHEFRHHLQNVAKLIGNGLTIEQDAHACSIRTFAKACPNMFLKAVKDGRIAALIWDDEIGQIINNPCYLQIQ